MDRRVLADGNLQYISKESSSTAETENFLHSFYVWQIIHCYPVLKNLYSEVIRITSDNNKMGHCPVVGAVSQTSTSLRTVFIDTNHHIFFSQSQKNYI